MESTISNRAVALLAGAAIAAAGTFAVATMAPQQAEAAAYKTAPSVNGRYGNTVGSYPMKCKVGKQTFVYNIPYSKRSGYKVNSSTLKVVKKGKSRVLVKRLDSQFTTNGKYLYYTKQKMLKNYGYTSKSKFTVYRMTVKTKKTKKVFSCKGYEASVLHAKGKYLYVGVSKTAGDFDGKAYVYAINVKTGSKKSLGKNLNTTFARAVGNRVVVSAGYSAENYKKATLSLYSFKLNGTDKKKIGNIDSMSAGWNIKGNKIRYAVKRGYKSLWKSGKAESKWEKGKNWKVYQCTNLGKHKKAVTGWVNSRKVEKVLNNR